MNVPPEPLKLPVRVPALLLLGLLAYVVLQVPERLLPVCASVNTTLPFGWPAGTVLMIAPVQLPAMDCVEGEVGADEPQELRTTRAPTPQAKRDNRSKRIIPPSYSRDEFF